MSAYIVDREHVRYLVTAAASPVLFMHHGHLAWVWNIDREAGTYERADLRCCDYDEAARVGQMVWAANVASVRHRYPDCDELPGPLDRDYNYGAHRDSRLPVTSGRVLKACAGFEYQSCEHPGWPTSEAKAFIEALRAAAWRQVDGYDEAPWEVRA